MMISPINMAVTLATELSNTEYAFTRKTPMNVSKIHVEMEKFRHHTAATALKSLLVLTFLVLRMEQWFLYIVWIKTRAV